MSDSEASDHAPQHTDYRLKVTAGPAYDTSTHQVVPVNSPKTLTFEKSPSTSPYFEHKLHTSDQYSISFNFIPKVDIPGADLVFGNDFERPIRDRLPPGFNQALKIVKWWIDPGLEGDAYSDKPYLYGPALSSWNILHVGDQIIPKDQIDKDKKSEWKLPNSESFHETIVEEGGDESGLAVRQEQHIPADSAGRKKYFLTESHRESFTFEAGRLYQTDFGNPYLDFNDFSLKLPGFSLNVIKYIDNKSHELRYTLKNRSTGEVYAVVLFTLLFGEELEEEQKNWTASEVGEKQEPAKNSAAAPAPAGKPTPGDDDDDGVD